MIKAIETQYKGYRFRSRLEARYAVMFDAMGIRWEYEPQGFECDRPVTGEPGTIWYLPDFWLPDLNTWVEVKGTTEGFDLIKFTDCAASLSGGEFDEHCDEDTKDMLVLGPLSSTPRTPITLHWHKQGITAGPWRPLRPSSACSEAKLGDRSYFSSLYGSNLPGGCSSPWGKGVPAAAALLLAGLPDPWDEWGSWWNVAKRARFEHGETPIVPAVAPAPQVSPRADPFELAKQAGVVVDPAKWAPPKQGELSGMRCIACKQLLRWGQIDCKCGDRINMPWYDKRLLRPR